MLLIVQALDASMLQFLSQTFDADAYTRIVVALLSISAGLLTKRALSQPLFAVGLVPGFAFGALLINDLFERCAIYLTADRETNVVVACALGTILALFVLFALVRLTALAAEACAARYQFRSEQESDRRKANGAASFTP